MRFRSRKFQIPLQIQGERQNLFGRASYPCAVLGETLGEGAGWGLKQPREFIRGQLQHLFSLHDSGVEQVFIDTLSVFLYSSIRGLKDSADCAVCLNEFKNEDRLRLLSKSKHAFHVECIDT